MEYSRTIVTNLPNEKKYGEMLASVIGQLSDGIWENSPRCQGYWAYAECNSGSTNIHVSPNYRDYYCSNIANPYIHMSDMKIKRYFARKLKEICLINMKDEYEDNIAQWLLKDMQYTHYVKDEDEFQARYSVYRAYMKAHPFDPKGKFNSTSDYQISYLGYDETITVADVYKAYKILTRREVK